MKNATALIAVFFFSKLPEALACVGCRAPGTAGPPEPQTITAGIALSWGVVGMLAAVFGIVGFLVWYIAGTIRRIDGQRTPQ